MKPNNPANTAPSPCPTCQHDPANAGIGEQITYLISQMDAPERAQMMQLIDGILAASRQPSPQLKPTQKPKACKKH